jgi:hypothetical protein
VPVAELVLDLMGDGVDAPVTIRGDDLRPISALRFRPTVAGTWSVELRATDACGRVGATGLRRDVVVRP